ncbi:MAG: Hsp70 family protein [Pseudomonadota bacterium]
MTIGIGVDFGTTNSAAAVFDGERLRFARLEQAVDIMPSALYLDRDLQRLTGQDAIDRYVADNTGRTVELVPEVIGESTLLVGGHGAGGPPPETLTTKIYGQPTADSGLQGRLFRGTKRLLGDPNVRRLMVFDAPFRLVALVTPILVHIRRQLQALDASVARALIGHPVNFEGRDQHKNQLAMTRLSEAYKYAGFTTREFYPEPTAAAVSFLHAHASVDGEHLLTLDFGGGTLDFCVLRRAGSEFSVVTTYGVPLGGDHIDQRLFRALLFPLLGKGERYVRRGFDRQIDTPFPFEDYEDLLVNWAVSYTLNQNRFTTPVLECLEQDGPARIKFRRLSELIQQNLSYVVFQTIKDFKARLSHAEEAVLDIPELDIEVRMTRNEFEALIKDQLDTVEQAVDETLRRAGLPASAIDIVLGTGGSSLIPAVRNILTERFGARVREHDPFTSVAAGLAIADYRRQTGAGI